MIHDLSCHFEAQKVWLMQSEKTIFGAFCGLDGGLWSITEVTVACDTNWRRKNVKNVKLWWHFLASWAFSLAKKIRVLQKFNSKSIDSLWDVFYEQSLRPTCRANWVSVPSDISQKQEFCWKLTGNFLESGASSSELTSDSDVRKLSKTCDKTSSKISKNHKKIKLKSSKSLNLKKTQISRKFQQFQPISNF